MLPVVLFLSDLFERFVHLSIQLSARMRPYHLTTGFKPNHPLWFKCIKKKVVSKLHFGKRFVCLSVMYSRTSAVNWICERKSKKLRQSEERGSLKRERGEDWGKGKEKEVFKWVCGKAGWHWNRHAPSHNGRDINFSTLSVSPLPSLFLSLPLSFPPSALPLHLASSRSLTPFPLFHSFSLLRSSFLFLFCLHHPTLLFLPAFFFFATE